MLTLSGCIWMSPTQEKSAREIARFSQKDADKWLKMWELEHSEAYQRVQMDNLFLPPETGLETSDAFGPRSAIVATAPLLLE